MTNWLINTFTQVEYGGGIELIILQRIKDSDMYGSIGSGNGLVLSGYTSSPELMLTRVYGAAGRHWTIMG